MTRFARTQRALITAMACALVLGALPAHADGARAAAAMAKQAIRAYEAGDHVRAAQIYVNAWRTDPKTPAYLYAAARSEHASDQLERAEAHYREFIVAPGAGAALIAKAEGFLKDLREARSGAKERDAARAARDENWKLAGQLYLDAYGLAPDRASLLFRAAMANESSGDASLAEGQYREYLRTGGPGAADRKEAEIHLEQLTRKSRPRPETPQPRPPPAIAQVAPLAEPNDAAKPDGRPESAVTPTSQAPPAPTVVSQADSALSTVTSGPTTSGPRVAAWSSLGGGVALGIAAGIVYALAVSQRSDLDKALASRDASGQIIGISRDAALEEKSKIEFKKTTAAVLGGTGLAAVGVGVWMWLRHPPGKMAIGPGPGDVGLAIRFER